MNHVPKGWKLERLGDVAQFVNGRGFKPHEWGETGLPIIRIQNLNGSPEFNYYNGEFDPKLLIKPGALLFAWSGSKGSSFGPHFWRMPTDGLLNYHTWKVECSEKVSPAFLFQALRQLTYTIENKAQGAAGLVHIQKGWIEAWETPMPPLCEQDAIASTLLFWDDAIGKQEALLQAEGTRKRGLMQQLLTGQKRFREYLRITKRVNTRYGCFPADWAAVHIGDIADEISGKNDAGRELPVLSCTKHRGLVNSLEYFGKRIFSANTSNYKVVRRGDFAYATNHIEEGSIGYQGLHDAALISPMYTVFRTRAGVDHSFFFKLVKTELYRNIFEVNTSGSIARRGGLRWDEFAIIKVFLPSVPEQKRIAAVLEVCDREIGLLQQQLEALQEQKRGLMHKLLTGEVRVKV
jgi:type I restriction enzyme S subunit